MVSAHDHQAGQFAVGARRGLKRDSFQPRDLREIVRQFIQKLQAALAGLILLHRMQSRKTRQGRHVLVNLRVVLDGARTQRVHGPVWMVVQCGEAGIVADDVDLADLGQFGRRASDVRFGQVGRKWLAGYVGRGQGHAPSSG